MRTELKQSYQAELTLLRLAYTGVAMRAHTAFALVQRIRQAWLWLPREATLARLASNLYFSAGTDACESYDSVADFQAELTGEVDAAWLEQSVIEGERGYLIRPYFAGGLSFAGDLNIGYLNYGAFSEVAGLDVSIPQPAVAAQVHGLTESELQDVIQGATARVLNLVNILRNLVTALNYVQSDVDSDFKKESRGNLKLRLDGQLIPLLAELQSVVQLPIGPAPARHFSSNSNQLNVLESLTSENLAGLAGIAVVAEPSVADVRVLISPRPGGFTLAPPVLDELYMRSPDYFDEPLSASEFSSYAKAYPNLPEGEAVEFAIPGLLIRGTDAFFLKARDSAVRVDAWLLSEFDRLGAVAFSGNPLSGLKAVLVPGGLSWGIHEEDNGSESVRESHRVWD